MVDYTVVNDTDLVTGLLPLNELLAVSQLDACLRHLLPRKNEYTMTSPLKTIQDAPYRVASAEAIALLALR